MSKFPGGGLSRKHGQSANAEIHIDVEDVVSASSRNENDSVNSGSTSDRTESAAPEETVSVRAPRDSLLDAAKAGSAERVRLILEADQGEVNVNEKEGRPLAFAAVHHAATNGDNEVMGLLLNCPGIDLNVPDGLGRTALIIACKEGHALVVRLLLQCGADVLKCARGDFTCLHMAAFCGHEEVVNLLVHGKGSREFWEKRDSRNDLPLLPLQVRCEFLKKKSSLEKFTALHMATRCSLTHHRGLGIATSLVEAYMAASLEIHEFGPFDSKEIFRMANEDWYRDFLLEIRDIINVHQGETSSDGSRHRFRNSDRAYGSVTSMKQKYEGVSVYEALVDAFEALTLYVNAKDCMGRTALHYAAWRNNSSLVEFLVWDFLNDRLSLGSIANVNATDVDGYTPLHFAAWKGNPLVVTALLLDARERDRFGLHDPELKFVADQFTLTGLDNGENYHECNILQPNAAAKSNGKSREVANEVELEFEFQDVDENSLLPRPKLQIVLWEEERGGLTALHYAVERDQAEVVELLLSHPKIDVFGVSSDGKTPWTMAFPKGRTVSEYWNTNIAWMLRTGGKLLETFPAFEDKTQKLQFSRAYKYKQVLVDKAVSLAYSAESNLETDLSNELTLYVVLEIQICLSLVDRLLLRDNDHHDQDYPFPLNLADLESLSLGDLTVSKGFTDFSHDHERQINDKMQKWEKDRSRKPWKLTLLHVTVYYGFHKELRRLLALQTFKDCLNARERITGRTALDLAVTLCNTTAVNLLLQEASLAAAEAGRDGRTPLEIAIDMQSKDGKLERLSERWKGIEGLLRGRADVQRYVDNLYRDRQVFVDAANAILVGAALIASVTFAGWLQPPLSYTYREPTRFAAPPNSENFAAVEQESVRVFWAFNSLSFFSAVATVVAGAGTVLPAPGQFIKTEVQAVRRWLVFTSMLLSLSIFCVLGAFTAAGLAALPPVSKYRNNMVFTSVVGLLLCLAVIAAFLHKLYFTLKSRLKVR